MLTPRARATLDRKAWQALEQLVDRHEPRHAHKLSRALQQEGPEGVLGHPAFNPELLWNDNNNTPLTDFPLELLLYALSRQALAREHIDSAQMADYVATMLMEFGQPNSPTDTPRPGDTYLFEVMDDALDQNTKASGQRMGNLALWVAGIWPDWVTQRQRQNGGPGLNYYDQMGRAGYQMASKEHQLQRHNLTELMKQLARRFVTIRQALNDISDRLLFPSPGPMAEANRLIRDVRDKNTRHQNTRDKQ